MSSSPSRTQSASLLISLLFLSSSALSADTDKQFITEDDFYGELPFTLTATRLPQTVRDSPVSITVIDREMIEAYDPQELIDVLRLVPGFQTIHPKGYRVSPVYHGLGTEYTQRMQVLVDGRSAYSPMFGHTLFQNLAIEMEDVERIEVTRGPNAASYGANAFTATINIITRHPADTQGTYFKVTTGQRDTQRVMARYGNRTDKLDYRFSISHRSDDGFDDDRYPDEKRIDSLGFRGDYQANLDNSFTFEFGYSDKTNTDGDNKDADHLETDPLRDVKTETNFQLVKWKHQISATEEFSLQLSHNYENLTDEYPLASLDDILGAGADNLFGQGPNDRVVLDNGHAAHRYDVEFQHNLKLDDELRLVWGASARLDQIGAKEYFSRKSHTDFFNKYTYRLFAHSEWKPSSVWTINAGIMIENNDITGTDLSPRLSINHHFSDNHTLRASYSSALRTPSTLEEHADTASKLTDGRRIDQLLLSYGGLDPEKLTSLELAYIGHFPKYGIDLDVKLFYDRIRDVLGQYQDENYADYNAGAQISKKVLIFDNIGYSNSKGLEAQLNYNLFKGTRIHLGYTILDVEGRSISTINDDGVNGVTTYENTHLEAPRTIFNAQVIQDMGPDVKASASFHRYSEYEFGGGNPTGDYKILNWRVAKTFRTGSTKGKVAFSLQNALDEYFDYEREQTFESRAFLSFELNFD